MIVQSHAPPRDLHDVPTDGEILDWERALRDNFAAEIRGNMSAVRSANSTYFDTVILQRPLQPATLDILYRSVTKASKGFLEAVLTLALFPPIAILILYFGLRRRSVLEMRDVVLGAWILAFNFSCASGYIASLSALDD